MNNTSDAVDSPYYDICSSAYDGINDAHDIPFDHDTFFNIDTHFNNNGIFNEQGCIEHQTITNEKIMTSGNKISNENKMSFDIIPDESELVDPYEHAEPKFIIATRETLVAQYVGHTAIKTRKVLNSALGGVLFIDEAYSLCYAGKGTKDKFGEECLTTINEFMSIHPNEIVIIFAGYKEKLMNSIFKVQPGLYRRCWMFEIKNYTAHGLAEIFKKQLEKNHWLIDSNIDIKDIFEEHIHLLQDGGGSTEKLAFQCKIAYGKHKFAELVNNDNNISHSNIITGDMLEDALQQMDTSEIRKINTTASSYMYM